MPPSQSSTSVVPKPASAEGSRADSSVTGGPAAGLSTSLLAAAISQMPSGIFRTRGISPNCGISHSPDCNICRAAWALMHS